MTLFVDRDQERHYAFLFSLDERLFGIVNRIFLITAVMAVTMVLGSAIGYEHQDSYLCRAVK